MDLIPWDASLETGNTVIDQQHRGLFGALNRLIQSMNRGKGRDEVHATLVFLRDYTQRHFSSEEAIMEQHVYADLLRHKALHAEFIAKLETIEHRYEQGAAVTISVMQFVRDWLTNHIKTEDQLMTQRLSKKD